MQITFPSYYKKFSCIADACPDTCCAGWQIMIDDKSLSKYRHFQGSFRNRLHNDINWKEHAFRQYGHRCAFLNEENLCDMYIEAGSGMLCDTCRRYPRHIEEFEGMREISLSLSCPEAARIILSQKDPVTFRTFEKETAEEAYEDFDYFLFSALMDTRDYLLTVLQDRSVPVRYRMAKFLVCTHDFQLAVNKQELFSWETIRARHEQSGFSSAFRKKISGRCFPDMDRVDLMKQIWKTIVPKLEVLSPDWTVFLKDTLISLYHTCSEETSYMELLLDFQDTFPEWQIQKEQLLVYWLYTYFCGAVYDEKIFAKGKMAVICTLFIEELVLGLYARKREKLEPGELVSVCYRFSRELEHSDQNLNTLEELLDQEEVFSLEHLMTLCSI